MVRTANIEELLAQLNPQQREAATHGQGPLLIVAGAGTGKTATLVHRVAWLIAKGTDPGRILLLTFTRRAAAEMLRRADALVRALPKTLPSLHGIGAVGAGVDVGEENKPLALALSQRERGLRTIPKGRGEAELGLPAFGAARSMPLPRDCCGVTENPSACRPNSPSTTAPIRKT